MTIQQASSRWWTFWCIAVHVAAGNVAKSWGDEPNRAAAAASAPIRLNTVGYLPGATKQATVTLEAADFIIRDVPSGEQVLGGRLAPIAVEKEAAHPLRLADFSALDRQGHYQIVVHGAEPREFRVADDVYNWPLYCALRAMYLWRCGMEVEARFAGHTYHHGACHLDDAYLDHIGGPPGQRKDGTGGWHDAGDYNKYTVNGAFAAGMLLQAWDHFGERLAPLALDIPESDYEMPDFLDEVRWQLEWLLKMQADDGRVYHKISTLEFSGFLLPDEEAEPRCFGPWSSAGTASFVAVMAHAARVYRDLDGPFADRCLAAAEAGYGVLEAHPQQHRADLSAFSTGEYHAPDTGARLWAAAQLWESTGQRRYLRDLEQRLRARWGNQAERPAALVDKDWDWSNPHNLGVFTYLLSQRPERDAELVRRVRRDALQAADDIVQTARRHPYGRTLGTRHYWGCNGTVVRLSINLHVAHRLSGAPRFREAMLDALNHVLGRNPFGRSYVTGIGQQPPMFPHDRRSAADGLAPPWPGYLVGGPWPGPTDWFDVVEDYRTNEIAINWNGALIYALAAFVEPDVFDASVAAAKQRHGEPTCGQEPR